MLRTSTLHLERVHPKLVAGCLSKHICLWRVRQKPRCSHFQVLDRSPPANAVEVFPRHLSSACTFRCHASGKCRTSLRKFSTYSSKHAKSTIGTSAPPGPEWTKPNSVVVYTFQLYQIQLAGPGEAAIEKVGPGEGTVKKVPSFWRKWD